MVKNDLSISEMKKIAHEIIDSELEQYGVKANVYPVTFIEFYSDYVFNKNKRFNLLQKIELSGSVISFSGFQLRSTTRNTGCDIVIFLNRVKKLRIIKKDFFELVKTCYHEARHVGQETFDQNSYGGFLNFMDYYTMVKGAYVSYSFSASEHDSYSLEIGANLYGVTKAKEYLMKNYPKLYEKEKVRINQLLKKYTFDYLVYDAVDTIDLFIKTNREMIRINKEMIKNIDNVNLMDPQIRDNEVCNVFFNEDMSFKKIGEIISNDKFEEIDEKIVNAFFSCKSFLHSLKMESLSLKELEIIANALNYTNTIYQNQVRLVESNYANGNIGALEVLKLRKSLIRKINEIAVASRKLNDAVAKKSHSSNHLNKSKMLIKKKKSSGFIASDIFYIIGLVFSLLTIIYMMLR